MLLLPSTLWCGDQQFCFLWKKNIIPKKTQNKPKHFQTKTNNKQPKPQIKTKPKPKQTTPNPPKNPQGFLESTFFLMQLPFFWWLLWKSTHYCSGLGFESRRGLWNVLCWHRYCPEFGKGPCYCWELECIADNNFLTFSNLISWKCLTSIW